MRPKKKNSIPLRQAAARAAAISSITGAFETGEGLNLAGYRAAIETTREQLDSYNRLLSQADEARAVLAASEVELSRLSRRMLAGIVAQYGSDSVQYEKAGGVRDSERRRPRRKMETLSAPSI